MQIFPGSQEIQATHLMCTSLDMLFTEGWLAIETKPLFYFLWSHNTPKLKYAQAKESQWSPSSDPYIQPQVLAANSIWSLSTYWMLTHSRQFYRQLGQDKQSFCLQRVFLHQQTVRKEKTTRGRWLADTGTNHTHPSYNLTSLPHLLCQRTNCRM